MLNNFPQSQSYYLKLHTTLNKTSESSDSNSFQFSLLSPFLQKRELEQMRIKGRIFSAVKLYSKCRTSEKIIQAFKSIHKYFMWFGVSQKTILNFDMKRNCVSAKLHLCQGCERSKSGNIGSHHWIHYLLAEKLLSSYFTSLDLNSWQKHNASWVN